MRVLNILLGGGVGGIENLCKDIGKNANFENGFCFLLSDGMIYDEMQNAGLQVFSLTKCSKRKFSFSRLKALISIAKGFDIIVVHHSALVTQVYYLFLKMFLPKKKYVLIAHSCFDKKDYYNYNCWTKNFLRKWVLTRALIKSNKIVFVSNAGKNSYLENFKIPEEKTCVVYNGVDNSTLQQQLGEITISIDSHRKYKITYIGRLVKVKGIELLIEAVRELNSQGIDMSVSIVGDGEYRSTLEKQVKKYHLEQIITFEGIRRDIAKYLIGTDVFVYPSVWEEVFGISIVEAMAYGVPCVGNKVGGIPEIIVDGYNGILSEDKTGKAIGEAIKKLISIYEDGKALEIKENCRQTALKFDIKRTVEKLGKCYREIEGLDKISSLNKKDKIGRNYEH